MADEVIEDNNSNNADNYPAKNEIQDNEISFPDVGIPADIEIVNFEVNLAKPETPANSPRDSDSMPDIHPKYGLVNAEEVSALPIIEINTRNYFSEQNEYSFNITNTKAILDAIRDTANSTRFIFEGFEENDQQNQINNRVFNTLLYLLSKTPEAYLDATNSLHCAEALEINKYINYFYYFVVNRKTDFINQLDTNLNALKNQLDNSQQQKSMFPDVKKLFQAEIIKNESIQLIDIASILQRWDQRLFMPTFEIADLDFKNLNNNHIKFQLITAAFLQREPMGSLQINQPENTHFNIKISKKEGGPIPTMAARHTADLNYKEIDFFKVNEEPVSIPHNILSVNFDIDLTNKERNLTFAGSQAPFINEMNIDAFDPNANAVLNEIVEGNAFRNFAITVTNATVADLQHTLVQQMLALLKTQLAAKAEYGLKPVIVHTVDFSQKDPATLTQLEQDKDKALTTAIDGTKEAIEEILLAAKPLFTDLVTQVYKLVNENTTLPQALQTFTPQINQIINQQCGEGFTTRLLNTVESIQQESKILERHQHFWRNVPRFVLKIIPAIFYTVLDQFVNPVKALLTNEPNPNHKGLIKGPLNDFLRNHDRLTRPQSVDDIIDTRKRLTKIAATKTEKGINPGKSYGTLYSATLLKLAASQNRNVTDLSKSLAKQTVALF